MTPTVPPTVAWVAAVTLTVTVAGVLTFVPLETVNLKLSGPE